MFLYKRLTLKFSRYYLHHRNIIEKKKKTISSLNILNSSIVKIDVYTQISIFYIRNNDIDHFSTLEKNVMEFCIYKVINVIREIIIIT